MQTDFLPVSRPRAREVETGRAGSEGSSPVVELGCAQDEQGDPAIHSVHVATASPVFSFLTPFTLWKQVSNT